jgi:hypothetical protein
MEEFEDQEKQVELEMPINGSATETILLVATFGIWPFQG